MKFKPDSNEMQICHFLPYYLNIIWVLNLFDGLETKPRCSMGTAQTTQSMAESQSFISTGYIVPFVNGIVVCAFLFYGTLTVTLKPIRL